MRPPKGQSSLEFLVILAVALTIFIVIIALSNEQITDVGKSRARADVLASARDLASAANQVYLQGAGARKLVMVKLPSGYDAGRSFIANNTISLNFEGSDLPAFTDVEVVGSLPSSPGTYYLWVIAREGYVTIGPRSLVFIPGIILVTATAGNQTQTKTARLNASNDGNESLNVTLALYWSEAEVNVSFSNPGDQSFALDAGESRGIALIIDINASAIGSYSGYIDANASDGESERIDIIVEVSPLTCVPANVSVPGPGGPCPPHKVTVQTFRDSLYVQTQNIFDPSETVGITTLDWMPYENITIDIRDPLNASVAGFPALFQTNSTGGLYLEWNPAGQSMGAYSVIANDSQSSTSYSFSISSCT